MGRLIDAERLKTHYCWWAGGGREMTLDEAKKTFDTIIDVQPTVDVVEVVRCKDCIHSDQCTKEMVMKTRGGGYLYCPMGSDGFCSLGERREDGNNDNNMDSTH